MKSVFIILSLILLTSCQYMPKRQLDKALTKTTERYVAEVKRQTLNQQSGSQYSFTWREALEAMYTMNKSCLQASHRLDDAKIRQQQLWRSYIPGINAGVSDSVSLDELSSTFVDPNFTVNSFIAFGNLINLPKNLYTRKLGVIAAELSEQNSMRAQTIALYKLFEERRLWELEGEAYELGSHLVNVMAEVDTTEAEKARAKHLNKIESWQERERVWQEKIADFYNVLPGNITIDANSQPKITYLHKDLDFYDTQRWGKLQLKLLALQELSEDGLIRAAYIRYLPTPSLSVSSPAIYSNTSNTDFNVNDIRISPRLNWRLDTSGSISHQLKRLKRNKPLQEWERQRRVQTEVKRLLEGKEALQEAERKLTENRIARQEYSEIISTGLVDQPPETILENLQDLYREEITLNAEIITISSGFWLIDEAWWTQHKLPWKQAQKKKKQ